MTPEHKEVLEHLWACRKAASGEAGSPENTIYLDGYVAGLNQALTRLTPSHVNDMHEWAARQRETECSCEHWVAWECMECDGQCMCHQINLEGYARREGDTLIHVSGRRTVPRQDFTEWLLSFFYENNPLGDLAQDVQRDLEHNPDLEKTFNKDPNHLIEHMERMGACDAAMTTARKTVEMWERMVDLRFLREDLSKSLNLEKVEGAGATYLVDELPPDSEKPLG